jgi:hypothetical protein
MDLKEIEKGNLLADLNKKFPGYKIEFGNIDRKFMMMLSMQKEQGFYLIIDKIPLNVIVSCDAIEDYNNSELPGFKKELLNSISDEVSTCLKRKINNFFNE